MDTSYFRNRKENIIGEEKIRKYAVLVPIIETNEGLFVLFEKRSEQLKKQPGEICFPGGKLEINETLEECAVRETVEELECDVNQIKILGPGDLFISPFNVIIYPYLGIIDRYENTFSTDEVAEVIKVPLNFFRENQPMHFKNKVINNPPEGFPYEWIPNGENYKWSSGIYDVYFYQYKDTIIWGITAYIIKSMIELMDEYELFK